MMGTQEQFQFKLAVSRATLVVVTAAMSFALAGCCRQLNAIEQHQIDMGAMLEKKFLQMSEDLATVADDQLRLRDRFEAGTKEMENMMHSAEQNQLRLEDRIEKRLEQLISNIAAIENRQSELQLTVGHNSRQISNRRL
ncbi:MAG: hypothetical protein ACYST6_13465 [Planctomycetota bacterium]|jgi:hypothetical protein